MTLWIQVRISVSRRKGCPIRTSRDQRLFAPPPRLSQLATSFIAFKRQIIHQWLLVAWLNLLVLSLCDPLALQLSKNNYFERSALAQLVYLNFLIKIPKFLNLNSQILNALLEVRGFEPLTPCLQSRCSPSWATPPREEQLRFNI